jgi:D-alanyl-D-alanine carboxypeptidase/D-alanyl-D-alanine-endopeptidase (penicillin-binding protein 4)
VIAPPDRILVATLLWALPSLAAAVQAPPAAVPAAPTKPVPAAPAPDAAPAAPAGLAARLAPLASSPVFHPNDTGIAIIALPESRMVFERNATRPLKPASTQKILTSAAALALLRPEFLHETRLWADGALDAGGTLAGNLYLEGRGAPDLVGEMWWMMARRLADLGLRRVEGNLVGDDSWFDTARRPAGWPAPTADSWYNAPIGALSCNFNVVTVRLEPSPLLGGRPDLTLEPSASFFQVMNRAKTATQGTDLRVDRSYADGRNLLVVDGVIRRGGGEVVVHRAVEDPAQYALSTFREIARSAGIEIGGRIETGVVPAGARLLYRHESRPLGALVRDMNKNSSNFMAEMLVKTLGAQFVEVPGTTASGLAMVRTWLQGLGLDLSGVVLADGSGLSDDNRVPAGLLATVLARAAADFEIGPELMGSLPIGGADGTLSDRFAADESRRRVRAKTGRIAGALSLAGYAVNRDGHTFAFAVVANQPRGTLDAVHQSIDRLIAEVVGSTDADLAPPH